MSGEVLTQRRKSAESGVVTQVRLGDVCEQVRGVSYKPTDASLEPKEGYVPLLRANNIFEGVINHDDLVFVRQDRILASQYLRQGDVLVCTSSGSVKLVGKAAQIQANIHESFGAFCRVLRPNARLSARYFHHYFQSETYRKKISNKAAGANINNIRSEDLDELLIPLTPLAEQRRIAAKLDLLCDIIAKRKQQLVQLQQLVKSRFVEMFGDYDASAKKVTLGDICDLVTVGIANSATHAYADKGVVMFRNQNIHENNLDETDLIYIKEDFAAKYEAKTLRENDLLVTRTGYPGVACLVPSKYEGAQTFTTLIARLADFKKSNPVFVCHYINSAYGKRFVEKNKVGIAQQNFGAKALAELPIFLPPLALQREFAAFVEKVDKLAFAVRKSLESAEKLYRQQLSEAFS